MENVRDLKAPIRFRRLTAARHCSGIGEEHSVVGATSLYPISSIRIDIYRPVRRSSKKSWRFVTPDWA
jgi:hypothetical protein